MSQFESLFIRSSAPVHEEARVVAACLGMAVTVTDDGIYLSGPAIAGPGSVGGRIYRNHYSEPDASPDEVQAFDGYDTVFGIWASEPHGGAQQHEAELAVLQLSTQRPEVAMLLTHDLDLLTMAYLPGVGVHRFGESVTVDAPDIELWRPWVVR